MAEDAEMLARHTEEKIKHKDRKVQEVIWNPLKSFLCKILYYRTLDHALFYTIACRVAEDAEMLARHTEEKIKHKDRKVQEVICKKQQEIDRSRAKAQNSAKLREQIRNQYSRLVFNKQTQNLYSVIGKFYVAFSGFSRPCWAMLNCAFSPGL